MFGFVRFPVLNYRDKPFLGSDPAGQLLYDTPVYISVEGPGTDNKLDWYWVSFFDHEKKRYRWAYVWKRGIQVLNYRPNELYQQTSLHKTQFFSQNVLRLWFEVNPYWKGVGDPVDEVKLDDPRASLEWLDSLPARSIWAGYKKDHARVWGTEPEGFAGFDGYTLAHKRGQFRLEIQYNETELSDGSIYSNTNDITYIFVHGLTTGEVSIWPFQAWVASSARDGTRIGLHPKGVYALDMDFEEFWDRMFSFGGM